MLLRLIHTYVDHYNTVRLRSAIGYVAPHVMLAGRATEPRRTRLQARTSAFNARARFVRVYCTSGSCVRKHHSIVSWAIILLDRRRLTVEVEAFASGGKEMIAHSVKLN